MKFFPSLLFLVHLCGPGNLLAQNAVPDWRNIRQGSEIPTLTYSDQPYVVIAEDGAWVCVVTTGAGKEGQPGQHVVVRRSQDKGLTWSEAIPLEPAEGPEASYAVLLKAPSGRIYCFYNHNTDNLRFARADNPPYKEGKCLRVDSLGHFVFKFSDDHGRTWSQRRFEIPQRLFEIDRENPYGGEVLYFWNVGKPFTLEGRAYVPIHKVGGLGHGFFTRSEGALLRSPNLLSENDPEKIEWETLPEGDIGLRAPQGGGPIAEEQSFAVLSDGSLYCVYRTVAGHPVESYSRDGGRTWSPPQYKRFADGTLMKHPRAANFVWKCRNGKYLYWFHNHGGVFIRDHPDRAGIAYNDRNPAWLSTGFESDSPEGKILKWSQPEIVLYDDDPFIRMSYPDFIEDGTRCFLTETQKDIARVHEIDPGFLEKIWSQPLEDGEGLEIVREGLVREIRSATSGLTGSVDLPKLPELVVRDTRRPDHGSRDTRAGFSFEAAFELSSTEPGQVLFSNLDSQGRGIELRTAPDAAVEIALNDGRSQSVWPSDPGTIRTGTPQNLTAIVDGGPKIVMFVVDGRLQDGGEDRQFGWGRFNPNYRGIASTEPIRLAPSMRGSLSTLRIYNRPLLIREAAQNHKASVTPTSLPSSPLSSPSSPLSSPSSP
jgi:hypothetical protein